jgi:hypothetical protein
MAETMILNVSVRRSVEAPEDTWKKDSTMWWPEYGTLGELRAHLATQPAWATSPQLALDFRPEIWTFDPVTEESIARLDAQLNWFDVLSLTSQSCPRELAQRKAFVLFTFPLALVPGLCLRNRIQSWCLLIAFLWIGRSGPGAGRQGKGKEGSESMLLGTIHSDGVDAGHNPGRSHRLLVVAEAVVGFLRDLGLVKSQHGKVE